MPLQIAVILTAAEQLLLCIIYRAYRLSGVRVEGSQDNLSQWIEY
jgi:hypothetical protein